MMKMKMHTRRDVDDEMEESKEENDVEQIEEEDEIEEEDKEDQIKKGGGRGRRD